MILMDKCWGSRLQLISGKRLFHNITFECHVNSSCHIACYRLPNTRLISWRYLDCRTAPFGVLKWNIIFFSVAGDNSCGSDESVYLAFWEYLNWLLAALRLAKFDPVQVRDGRVLKPDIALLSPWWHRESSCCWSPMSADHRLLTPALN